MRRDEGSLVQNIGHSRMLRLRDQLLPMVSLNDLLELPKNIDNGYYVAVLEVKGRRFGLIVDDLLDPQEIVVKPLSRVLRASGVFSGASVLGNGQLALILDIAGLAARGTAKYQWTEQHAWRRSQAHHAKARGGAADHAAVRECKG